MFLRFGRRKLIYFKLMLVFAVASCGEETKPTSISTAKLPKINARISSTSPMPKVQNTGSTYSAISSTLPKSEKQDNSSAYSVVSNTSLIIEMLDSDSVYINPEINNTSSTATSNSTDDGLVTKEEMDCSTANLRTFVKTNFKTKAIDVSFEMTKEEFNHCFSYFQLFLIENGAQVALAKIPFNNSPRKPTSYSFENVSCALYEVRIWPCYTDGRCASFIVKYPKLINMTAMDCSDEPGTEESPKFISVIIIATLLMICIGCSVAYCAYFKLCVRRKIERTGKEISSIDLTRAGSEERKSISKRIKVYILHYSNEAILKNVEILKNFLSYLPHIEVVLIRDELHRILFDRTWWVNDALQVNEDIQQMEDKECPFLKKVIIVDADKGQKRGSLNKVENENEDEVFDEARTKLGQDWLRSLNDYDRIFVIRFNGLSPIKSEALKYVVPGVRYDIPDNQLLPLCEILLSGPDFKSCVKEKDIMELIEHHPIKGLSSSVKGSYYV